MYNSCSDRGGFQWCKNEKGTLTSLSILPGEPITGAHLAAFKGNAGQLYVCPNLQVEPPPDDEGSGTHTYSAAHPRSHSNNRSLATFRLRHRGTITTQKHATCVEHQGHPPTIPHARQVVSSPFTPQFHSLLTHSIFSDPAHQVRSLLWRHTHPQGRQIRQSSCNLHVSFSASGLRVHP